MPLTYPQYCYNCEHHWKSRKSRVQKCPNCGDSEYWKDYQRTPATKKHRGSFSPTVGISEQHLNGLERWAIQNEYRSIKSALEGAIVKAGVQPITSEELEKFKRFWRQ